MVKDIFEIETLGSKKFICHSESGNWVLADYLDETVIEKISLSYNDLYKGISLVLLNVGRTCNFDCIYCLIGDLKQEGNRMPNKVGMKAIDRIIEGRKIKVHVSDITDITAKLVQSSTKPSENIK